MYRVGIDLGGTNIKAGIVNDNQKILAESSVPTGVERPYEEIIKDMADLVKDLLKKTGIEEREIRSVGVGSPGTVDAHNGIVLYSNNFGWENVPLAKELGKYFPCPVHISNDANCAALGEVKAGAAKEIKNAILLTAILLSGGVCNQKEKLTKPLTEYIQTKCFGGDRAFIPEVRCAALGNHAGIIGAANL